MKKLIWYLHNLGSALAITISYVNYHSIGWAFVHGLFSWFYVIYYANTNGFYL